MSGPPPLADGAYEVHNSTMNLKTAAFLALIGMALLTILLAADFINVVMGVMRDVVPAMALLRSLIYLLASQPSSSVRSVLLPSLFSIDFSLL
jgi:hypothetical protein